MITLDQQIACVKREIGMRERVYPAWVNKGKMKQESASYELDAMRAVLKTLESNSADQAAACDKPVPEHP